MYRVVLFLHLAGAIATFVGIGAWFFTALSFRRAQRTSEIKTLAPIFEMSGMLAVTGILLAALTGIDMALSFWSLREGWIQVSIGAFALLAPVGPFLVTPRLARLIRQARANRDDFLSAEQRTLARDPVIKVGLLSIIGGLAGIVFIMAVKPAFAGSLTAVAASVALALLLSLPPAGRLVSAAIDALVRLEESNPLYR